MTVSKAETWESLCEWKRVKKEELGLVFHAEVPSRNMLLKVSRLDFPGPDRRRDPEILLALFLLCLLRLLSRFHPCPSFPPAAVPSLRLLSLAAAATYRPRPRTELTDMLRRTCAASKAKQVPMELCSAALAGPPDPRIPRRRPPALACQAGNLVDAHDALQRGSPFDCLQFGLATGFALGQKLLVCQD